MYYSIPGTLFHIYKQRFFSDGQSNRKKILKREDQRKSAAAERQHAAADHSAKPRRKTRAAV